MPMMLDRRRVLVMLITGFVITLTIPALPMASFDAGPGTAEHEAIDGTTSAVRSAMNGRSSGDIDPDADQTMRAGVAGDNQLNVGGLSPSENGRPPQPPDSDNAELSHPSAGGPDDDGAHQRSRSETVGWELGSIDAMHSTHSVVPTGVRVPSIGIDAHVEPVGVDLHGDMVIPDMPNHVGWYRYGSVPGEPGSAVIAGHLDDYEGESVFFELARIEPDARVDVLLSDGTVTTFRVRGTSIHPADQLPADQIFAREGDPVLALITCTGDWDDVAGRYTETMVVYAMPAS